MFNKILSPLGRDNAGLLNVIHCHICGCINETSDLVYLLTWLVQLWLRTAAIEVLYLMDWGSAIFIGVAIIQIFVLVSITFICMPFFILSVNLCFQVIRAVMQLVVHVYGSNRLLYCSKHLFFEDASTSPQFADLLDNIKRLSWLLFNPEVEIVYLHYTS